METQDKKIKQKIFSPLEEFKLIGNFPWMMVIHFLLLVLTTAQAILIIEDKTAYTRAQERIIYNLFINDSPKNKIDFDRYEYLYSVSDLKKHLNRSIYNYFNLKQNFLENVEYVDNNTFVKMEFSYIDNDLLKLKSQRGSIKRSFFYIVNNKTLGPFDKNDIEVKNFLNDVVEFKLNYKFQTLVPRYYYNNFECFLWTVTQQYTFAERAHFVSNLVINRNNCYYIKNQMSIWENIVNRLLWIHLAVMALATASFISSWRYIYEMATIYGKIHESKRRYSNDNNHHNYQQIEENDNESVESFSKKEKFDSWSVVCTISNMVQVFGAGISLFDSDNVMSSTEILVGFGCFLAYINIGRYLKFYPHYSTIFETISRALPNVLRYLLGVVPLFLGFLFLGLCMFWRSERFSNTSNSMISLFAILNGDSVMDSFRDLSSFSFLMGQIYIYLFSILFMVVVMNVFIAIIEEAYITIKMKDRNHWIYMYLKLDSKYIGLGEGEKRKNVESDKSVETYEKESERKENVKETQTSIKINEKAQNITKGLDYFYYKIEEEITQINKILEDVNNTNDNEAKEAITNYNKLRLSDLEKKINLLNQTK